MDNFFDDLKNNLNNRPEPEFEDSAWLAMEKKMQPPKERKRYFGGLWLMLFTIPFIFASGYSYLQMKEAQAAVNEMELQIVRDTVYSTRTVYVRDTIYQSTPIARSKSLKSSNPFIASYSLPLFSDYPFLKIKNTKNNFTYLPFNNNSSSFRAGVLSFSNSNSLLTYRNNSMIGSDSKPQKETPNNKTSRNLEVVLLSSLEIGFVERSQQFPITMNLQEVAILKKSKWRKRRIQIANMMRPKSFRLGFGGGYIYPTNENLSNRSGYALNLQGEVGFNENLSMWIDFSYLQLHLETESMEDEFGIPSIPLPNDDYIFDNATTDQPLLQYSVGMQYLFRTNKKLRPFLGAGISLISPQPYEVEYDYEDLAGNEIVVPKDYSNQGISSNQWIMKTGLEYKFGKRWSSQLEGYYRTSWKEGDNITPNILGVNTRLLYQF